MTVRKLNYRQRKAKLVKSENDYDVEFCAMLFFMWQSGMLAKYPLNSEKYPDSEDTMKLMTFELLKMKLRKEMEQIPSFKSKIVCK